MARYTGAKCKICRRERTKLFLKGSRCFSQKCGITKRNKIPGDHGANNRAKLSDFAKHLREKQKVKRIYGVLEAQFRRYYDKAASTKGITGQILLQLLESRLDSVLYNGGIALSRSDARKFIAHGNVSVNNRKVDVPSYVLKAGDKIEVKKRESIKPLEEIPAWLNWNKSSSTLEIIALPEREQISTDINEQLIVEYYSR